MMPRKYHRRCAGLPCHGRIIDRDAPEGDVDAPVLQGRDLFQAEQFQQRQIEIGTLRLNALMTSGR